MYLGEAVWDRPLGIARGAVIPVTADQSMRTLFKWMRTWACG